MATVGKVKARHIVSDLNKQVIDVLFSVSNEKLSFTLGDSGVVEIRFEDMTKEIKSKLAESFNANS